jgi:hypothetical protein
VVASAYGLSTTTPAAAVRASIVQPLLGSLPEELCKERHVAYLVS